LLTILQDTSSQLSNISGHVSQIEAVLAEHDKFSHAERAIESLQLIEVLNKASTFVPHDFLNIVSIEIDPEISELPAVSAERVVLTQVFAELLNNAAESIIRTDKTSGEIEIKGEVECGDDGEMAHIRVIDNGEGIDPGMLEHIFDREFSNKRSKGSGFGLHWCGNVISAMDGRIYAEIEGVDQGAIFHVLIPIIQ